jgi:hypothetical protein
MRHYLHQTLIGDAEHLFRRYRVGPVTIGSPQQQEIALYAADAAVGRA